MTPIHPQAVRAWLAVSALSRTQSTVTVRDVAAEMGLSSPYSAHKWLMAARRLGMVDWRDNKAGTLHPTMVMVLGPEDLDVDRDFAHR